MRNTLMRSFTLALVVCCVVLGCTGGLRGPYEFHVLVPGAVQVAVSPSDIRKALDDRQQAAGERAALRAEITVIRFSTGKKVFTYSGEENGDIREEYKNGAIEALVKVRRGDAVVKTFFVSAEGPSREKIINAFADELRARLNMQNDAGR